MSGYAQILNPGKTPQSEALFGRETEQVKNNAGGFVFQITPQQQLFRFLIMGSLGGSYYASERNLTKTNADAVKQMILSNGAEAVKIIIDVSARGRAPKNDAAIFALAIAAVHGSDETKTLAFDAIDQVCRIPTHLFQFIEAYQTLGGGWGRRMKRAISNWYLGRDPEALAHTMSKYQSRDGWSHRDVLRLSHPVAKDEAQNDVFRWALDHNADFKTEGPAVDYLNAVNYLHLEGTTVEDVVKFINIFNFPREVVPTHMLKDKRIWEALLQKMPVGAMIRNLGNMSACGLLTPMSEAAKLVTSKLNKEALVRGRVHPIQLLTAALTYKQGRGTMGGNVWTPVQTVNAALDEAFYNAFGAVEPHGKRVMVGLDISGSMHGGVVNGVAGLTPAVASAAMAMLTARTETQYHMMGFGGTFVDLPFITKNASLTEVTNKTRTMNFGNTDCALPMIYALRNKIPVDMFQIYTDSETWCGGIHPSEALKKYRQGMGINAKLVVCGMVANQFTIADPKDIGMMDVVGFDTAAPQIIHEFVKW